jgi:Animal haem peroxidase
MLRSFVETPVVRRGRYLFVGALFILLLVLVYGGAELQGWLDIKGPPFNPPQSFAYRVAYHRVIFAIWATIVLATPALCFHVFSRADRPNTYWRAFWTAAYLAFLVHVYWAVWGVCGGSLDVAFHAKVFRPDFPECLVEHPGPDFFLVAWWGLDVILAWLITDNIKLIRAERGALHLVAFAMLFGAFVLASKAGIVAHLLGILMAILVIGCTVLRVIVRETDPKSLTAVVYDGSFRLLNLFVEWDKLPTFFAVMNLGALRDVLRANNLHNTSDIAVTNPAGLRDTVKWDPRYLSERQDDGQYNDLTKPTMGNASFNPNDPLNNTDFTLSNPGARFGRNIPLSEVDPTRDGGILDPSPRLVSNLLLGRQKSGDGTDNFKPATILNLLAAAWIQFQTHDWFNHGNPRPINDDPFDVPIPSGDSWPSGKMLVRRTRSDPTRKPNDNAGPTTYANAETHWWDASQIYGNSPEAGAKYRTWVDGKLIVDPNTRMIPLDAAGVEITGLTQNWWIGLSLLHNLFTLEHNAICDHLIREFPEWHDDPQKTPKERDEQIFRVARLVNNSLMAKIHTVDWTPAILPNPALQIGMNANWWGLAGESIKKYIGRISTSEAVSGITGSAVSQSGADYCLTEEFTAVYRLHPLLPNDIQIRHFKGDKPGVTLKFEGDEGDPDLIVGPRAMKNALRTASFLDLVYTFGVHYPGAVTLQNFPNWMRRMRRRNGANLEEMIDLAAIDILRDRERGVPRYNRFRKLFHKAPIRSFEQMTSDPKLAKTLREVYGHPDKVDLMVGMYAEEPPELFGFSDTAFRVFILMASRRLKSDRFYTDDFTPAVYTQAGIDWINNNNMSTVLLRHFPELTPILQRTDNAFAPWKVPKDAKTAAAP